MSVTEDWRAVAGYEGVYEVSSRGQVRSLARTIEVPCVRWGGMMMRPVKARILKQGTDCNSYFTVHLSVGAKRTAVNVHRLVAVAFCDKPEGCNEVNHRDGVKQNNAHTNLEWTTHQANVAHAVDTGLTNKRKKIVGTCIKTGASTEYLSATHAARAMGSEGRCGTISMAANGKLKTASGHTWRYL